MHSLNSHFQAWNIVEWNTFKMMSLSLELVTMCDQKTKYVHGLFAVEVWKVS